MKNAPGQVSFEQESEFLVFGPLFTCATLIHFEGRLVTTKTFDPSECLVFLEEHDAESNTMQKVRR